MYTYSEGLDDLIEILTSPSDLVNALLITVLIAPLTDFYFGFGPTDPGIPFITFVAQFAVLAFIFFVFAEDSDKAKRLRPNLFLVTLLLLVVALVWFFIMLQYSAESAVGLEIEARERDSFLPLMLDICWVFMFVTLASFLGAMAMIRHKGVVL